MAQADEYANEARTSARIREQLAELLLPTGVATAGAPTVLESVHAELFTRHSLSYESAGMNVEAFLFKPSVPRNLAVVVLHQHNSQWHIGKSEVAGTRGEPFQAFGPALARRGITVLAPDALGFESRMEPRTRDCRSDALAPRLPPERGSAPEDWLHFYNHAMHRLVRGELLMSRVLLDVASALSVLRMLAPCSTVGLLGHSYGGIGALFAGALLDVSFVVSSGALCSYRYKLEHGVGLDMSLVIPAFAARFDLEDVLRCIAPRPTLIVSADKDPYSADANELVERARPSFDARAIRKPCTTYELPEVMPSMLLASRPW